MGRRKNKQKEVPFNKLTHMVCQPIDKGGLSIRNPTLMNEALGDKLAW
jgi:hypothetical protein